jgi:hypothetical protein
LQLIQESLLKTVAVDFTGHVQAQVPVVTYTGNGTTVAPLAAQDKIYVLNEGQKGFGDIQVSHIGEGLGAEPVPMQQVDDINDDTALKNKKKE